MLCTRFLNPEIIMNGFPRKIVNARHSYDVIVVIMATQPILKVASPNFPSRER